MSTPVVTRVPTTEAKPDGFCTFARNSRTGDTYYVAYPDNWRDSYYFTFEGLNGYLLYAEQIDGTAVSAADQQAVKDQLFALQQDFLAEFDAMDPQNTTAQGAAMAQRAQETALALIDQLTAK